MGVVSCGTTMLDQGVFEGLGSVSWDTTAKTAGFTAVSGNGYFVNTTSGAITVTLPSSPSAGDIVGIKDYANTADTNAITIGRNGSNIQGVANDFIINTEGRSVILVYVDATKGWLITSASQASDISEPPAFVAATGGTITCCGDYKIHTFTGPGTFTVTCAGNPLGSNTVDYLVVAGGGGGGGPGIARGGGGAGGYRASGYGPAPSLGTSLPVSATGYPIVIGGGGAGGAVGSPSSAITITSTGGGAGRLAAGTQNGGSGGGGGNGATPAGLGNTPPVSPPQGNNGGAGGSGPSVSGGGGGGAGAVGQTGVANNYGGDGGNGLPNNISGSATYYAGGGGGATESVGPDGSGGLGGGGGVNNAGTANTGGGGGANANAGGSGIVIIRYKFQ